MHKDNHYQMPFCCELRDPGEGLPISFTVKVYASSHVRRTAGLTTIATTYLLSLVTQAASLVGAGGPGHPDNARQLAVLPAPDTEKEPQHIRLLLLPQLLNILVRTCNE